MKDNRYFVGKLKGKNRKKLFSLIIGNYEDRRKPNSKEEVILKLPLGDNANHEILADFKEYDHKGIREYIKQQIELEA